MRLGEKMAIVNEVITEFAFQGSTSPLTEYNESLGKSIGLLVATSAAIIGAAGAMAAFVTSTTKSLDPVIQLSRTTGVAVEALQELGFVASVTGSDATTLQSSISSLSDKIGEAAQKGSDDFARLGISVRDVNGDVKSADSLLLEIGERFKQLNLSLSEKRSFAQSLGIDPSLIQLLNLTGDALEGVRQKARDMGVVTKEQADAAVNLNDSLTTARFGYDALKNTIAVGLAPQIEDITEGFIDFLAANKDLIADGITNVIEIVTALAKTINRLSPLIFGVAGLFGIWKVASIGLGGVLGVILSPVYLITAGITALILIVDDLIVAMNGGKSVIGDFFNEFLGVDIVPILNSAYDAFISFVDSFISASKNLTDVFSNLFSGAFDLLTGNFDGAKEHFSTFFSGVVSIFSNGISEILSLLSGVGEQALISLTGYDYSKVGEMIAKNITDPIYNIFTNLFSWITEKFKEAIGLVDGVSSFFGFGDEEKQTELNTITSVDMLQDKQVNERVTLNEDEVPVSTVEDVSQERNINISDSVTLNDTDSKQTRNVIINDVVINDALEDIETPKVNSVAMMRDISLLNNFSQFGEIPKPDLSDLELNKSIGIDNTLDLQASGAFTLESQSQRQLMPQPNNVNNSNERNVTIDQKNQFNITGNNERGIASTVTDRLQDQLNDANTQLSVGGF